MSILLTGAAGFIGFHVAKALLERGDRVVGLDNLNDYYDVRLMEARLAQLSAYPGFVFAKLDVADRDGVFNLIEHHKEFRSIIHLAAQAGVKARTTSLRSRWCSSPSRLSMPFAKRSQSGPEVTPLVARPAASGWRNRRSRRTVRTVS